MLKQNLAKYCFLYLLDLSLFIFILPFGICDTRDIVLEFRNSRSAILVATDVAARGLGKNLQIYRYDVRVRLRWLFHICESRGIVMWQ